MARHPSARSTSSGAAKYVLVAPLGIFLTALVAFPTVSGIRTALMRYQLGTDRPAFAALRNFTHVLGDPEFHHALRFTMVFTIAALIGEMIVGIALALLFDHAFPGHRALLTAAMFPIMIAPAFMATLWRLSLNSDAGPLAAIVKSLGVSDNLLAPSTVVPTLIAVDTLHWAPFVMLLVYGGLQTVPTELYESAALDGAGYWRTRLSVVAPTIAPVLAVTVFLRLIDGLKTFDTIYVLTGGGPGTETTNINIYAYKLAFVDGDFGGAAAASTIFLLALALLVPFLTKRLTPTPARTRA